MSKVNKLMRSALYIKSYEDLFKCPICESPMQIQQLRSLNCSNNHTYDLAKQGYFNLLNNKVQTNYDKSLFNARRHVIVDSGLFDIFSRKIAQIISENSSNKPDLTIIDMGSGEGSYLQLISNTLRSKFSKTVIGVGVDISKEGIIAAARVYDSVIWLVADLANTPLYNDKFDVIINILSPSNYNEFHRLLKDDGFILKVIPRSNYLKELRDFFYKESDKKDYSNTKVLSHFKEHFELVDKITLTYSQSLDNEALAALVSMTPLTWGVPADKVNQFLSENTSNITIDFDILIGKKKLD